MNAETRCEKCGQRLDRHGGEDNPHRPFACPAGPVEPKWPSSIRDEVRAGEVYDARLAKHWTARITSFTAPVGHDGRRA